MRIVYNNIIIAAIGRIEEDFETAENYGLKVKEIAMSHGQGMWP